MIRVEGLTRTYRKGAVTTDVLKGVSLSVERAEFVAVMGASGSGKSTLLNILGFLDRPDQGSYLFEEADLAGADDATLSAIRNRRIGFVFQQFHLLPGADALRNVMLPLLYADGDAGNGEARARRVLESVGLGGRLHHHPGELSGGEQQRVAIARALINDPALILAVEPTGNLDADSGREILDLFDQLHAAGRTIIMVTHDPAVAARAARVIRIEDGRIRPDGAPPPASARAAGDATAPA